MNAIYVLSLSHPDHDILDQPIFPPGLTTNRNEKDTSLIKIWIEFQRLLDKRHLLELDKAYFTEIFQLLF